MIFHARGAYLRELGGDMPIQDEALRQRLAAAVANQRKLREAMGAVMLEDAEVLDEEDDEERGPIVEDMERQP